MGLTLNDFRAVLGKQNDGNLVLVGDPGAEALHKVNYGRIRIHERTESDPEMNMRVRNELNSAINNSLEGKALSTETINYIRNMLGIEGAGQSNKTEVFSRHDLAAILNKIDRDATPERMVALTRGALVNEGVHENALSTAGRINGFSAFASPEKMARFLPDRFLGRPSAEIKKFVTLNFTAIKARLFETAAWQAAYRGYGDEGERKIRPFVLLQQVIGSLMGEYARGQPATLRLSHLPEKINPPDLEGLDQRVKDRLSDHGLDTLKADLDSIRNAATRVGSFQGRVLSRALTAIYADALDKFKQAITTAGDDLAEINDSITKNFHNSAIGARMKLIHELVRDGKMLPAILARLESDLASAALAKPVGLVPKGKEGVSDFFFRTLEETTASFSIRKNLSDKVRLLFPALAPDMADKLQAHFQTLVDKADENGLREFYNEVRDELFAANGKAEAAASTNARLEAHVKCVGDAFIAGERVRLEANRTAEELFLRDALGLGIEILKRTASEDADDAYKTDYALTMMVVAELGEPEARVRRLLDPKIFQQVPGSHDRLVETLMSLPKERREFLMVYVRSGLFKADSNIANSIKQPNAAPLRDLITDRYLDINSLTPGAIHFLGKLAEASVSSYMKNICEYFGEGDKKAAYEAVRQVYGNLASIDPSKKDKVRQMDSLLKENPGNSSDAWVSYNTAMGIAELQVPQFKVPDLMTLFSELKDAGINFDAFARGENYMSFVSMALLAEINPRGVVGLDEFCQRTIGKPAREVTLEDALRFRATKPSDSKKAWVPDPLSKVKGDDRNIVDLFVGAKRLNEVGLKGDDLGNIWNAMKALDAGETGTKVSLRLFGKDLAFEKRANGTFTVTLNGLPFHAEMKVHDFRQLAEDALIASTGPNDPVKVLQAILNENPIETTPLLRVRELCVKMIAQRTGEPTVRLSGQGTEALLDLTREVLAGTKGAENIRALPVPNAYNSIDMVEMHAQMVAAEEAKPGSVGKVVKMATAETLRPLVDRQAFTRSEDVRALAADLMMNADTWNLDEAVLQGIDMVAGARLQRLALRYGPELKNIRENDNLLSSLPDSLADTLKPILKELAAIENPEAEGALLSFAALETRLETVAKEKMQSLQEIVSRLFVAKPADAKDMWQKSFDELAGTAGLDLATSQGQFAKAILDGYFANAESIDQRRMLAAVLRNTTADSSESKIVAELLKGSGPLLQKMLQGLPIESFDTETREALADMKSRLPDIAPDAVKAQMLELVRSSNGEILSIDVKRSLGAASVAQTFLCVIHTKERPNVGVECVIKVLRPTAQISIQREKALFDRLSNDAQRAEFAVQYANILTELDFTREASNVDVGIRVYENPNKKLYSMRRIDLSRPTMSTMILQKAPGKTVDGLTRDFKKEVDAILTAGPDPIRREIADEPNGPRRVVYEVKNLNELGVVRHEILVRRHAIAKARKTAQALVKTWLNRAIFEDGFFHGDLHAGNVMTDATGMTLIDFGNCGRLSETDRNFVLSLLVRAMTKSGQNFLDKVKDALDDAGKRALAAISQRVKDDIDAIMKKGYATDALSRIQGAFTVLQRANVPLPSSLTNFFQSFARLKGVVTALADAEAELADAYLQLNVRANEVSPLHESLVQKLPFVEKLDKFIVGFKGTIGEPVNGKQVEQLFKDVKTAINDQNAFIEAFKGLTREEKLALGEYLRTNFAPAGGFPPDSDDQLIHVLAFLERFATEESAKGVNDDDYTTFYRYVSGGFVRLSLSEIQTNGAHETYVQEYESFEMVVSDVVIGHADKLRTFMQENEKLLALLNMSVLKNELNEYDDHNDRVKESIDAHHRANVQAPKESQLTTFEMTAAEKAVRRFCRPLKCPYVESNWTADDKNARLFIETILTNRAFLAEALGALEPKHLKYAFEIHSESEGSYPTGKKNGPTMMGAIRALKPEDLQALRNFARQAYPGDAEDFVRTLDALVA